MEARQVRPVDVLDLVHGEPVGEITTWWVAFPLLAVESRASRFFNDFSPFALFSESHTKFGILVRDSEKVCWYLRIFLNLELQVS